MKYVQKGFSKIKNPKCLKYIKLSAIAKPVSRRKGVHKRSMLIDINPKNRFRKF